MAAPLPSVESLLSEAEAASLMSVSPRTLQAWRARGGGPAFVRVGSRIRYCPRALAAWFRVRSATRAATRIPKPVRLACRPSLPPRMVELIAGEIARGSAGEAYIGAAAYRRLSQALEPHGATLALSLCQGGEIRSDGTVGIVVPRNFAVADVNLDPRRTTFRVNYDPRSGKWSSEASAGEDGFDGFCAHVWRIQGRSEGMAARDLLAFIGAAYLAFLAEGLSA